MHSKFLLFCSLLLLNSAFSFAQTKEAFLSFYNSFEPIEFDLLHVYTDGPQEKAAYDLQNNYPFKGKIINIQPIVALLKEVLDINSKKVFFAIARYSINTQLAGLIIRIYDQKKFTNSIYHLSYNIKKNVLEQSFLLAYDYQTKDNRYLTQSWLLALNKDNNLDVLTRSYLDQYEFKKGTDNLEFIHEEKSHLIIFEDSRFQKKVVNNTTLQQSLEKDFPYRPIQTPFMKKKTQKAILKTLKKSGLVIPSEND